MRLTNCILGTFLELCSNKNIDLAFCIDNVRGVNNQKQMMSTKADLNGRDLSKFQIVYPGDFVFNHRTSRNGSKFSIAYNDGEQPVICTEDYVVFRVRDDCKNILNARWLYMFFNRPEFDRYVITNSWGSSTEFYNWEDIQAIELTLPDIETQRKYVNVYNAMLSNQQSYERGLEDLKLVCDAYIEDLRRQIPCEAIGPYIEERNEKNEGNVITLFQGVNVDHVFTEPKRVAEDSENGSVVRTGQFAFNKVMKAHNTKLPIALREGPDCVVSNSYQVFEVTNTNKLLKQYPYATGLKTGSTSQAKFCLSATATKDHMTLIAVIMAAENSRIRFAEATKLLEYGFSTTSIYSDEIKGTTYTLPVKKGASDTLQMTCQNNFCYLSRTAENLSQVEKKTKLPKEITAPVKKGDAIGEISYYLNGQQLGSIPLCADQDIEKAHFTDYYRKLLLEYLP